MNTNTGKTVLLIDDSKVSRMFAREYILECQPTWHVLEAASGEEGLALLAGRRVDIVILDVNMPGIGGMATAAQMRGRSPALPICILTANIQEATRERARGLDVDFAEKPVTRERILHILARLEV